jgi:hypothetical protein
MSSPSFEHVRRNNPGLSDLLDLLMGYINRQKENGQLFFLPKLAAASIGRNDGEAYVLLELLANAGVLQRAFNVYCKTNGELIRTVNTESELRSLAICYYANRQKTRLERRGCRFHGEQSPMNRRRLL